MNNKALFVPAIMLVMGLSACGGGGSSTPTSGSNDTPNDPTTEEPTPTNPEAVSLTLDILQTKTFRLRWNEIEGADSYRILENPDGQSGFSQVGNDIPAGTTSLDHIVPLHARVNASYALQSCVDSDCTDQATVAVTGTLTEGIGYIKPSTLDTGDNFGTSVSLSADGQTMVVGASGERSSATGINGDEANNAFIGAGAVYVFIKNDNDAWEQQAYLKPSNTDGFDAFGTTVALSQDGNRLAVGAPLEDSGGVGVNPADQGVGSQSSGAVYLFERDASSTWAQTNYIKPSNTSVAVSRFEFGSSLDLSDDGTTLAVGAIGETGSSSGINGDESALLTQTNVGAVYLFRDQGGWTQQAYIKASNPDNDDLFGFAVALSSNGNTLVVGVPHEDGGTSGINSGDERNYRGNGSISTGSTIYDSGAGYVFSFADNQWTQQAYVKASNVSIDFDDNTFTSAQGDQFGTAVAISGDGNRVAIGAPLEQSNATGIDGDQTDNSVLLTGAVYLFERENATWAQRHYIKASHPSALFGRSLALSSDGRYLGVGAQAESSDATGINGDFNNDNANGAGSAYVFDINDANTIAQIAYVKASNTEAVDNFGSTLDLSGDGGVLAISAIGEDSASTGMNGDQTDNSAASLTTSAGAVYLY